MPWTIHGGSIHWVSETAQDEMATSYDLGNEKKALEIVDKAIEETKRTVSFLSNGERDIKYLAGSSKERRLVE